ncbi:ATPase [Spirochaetia bacterium]|nr:ATPase [Spirochaetia bacterium]
MIDRPAYLTTIQILKDEPVVKFITGIRHSGKSFMMDKIINDLKACGVDDAYIIRLNVESSVFDGVRTGRDLENYITAKLQKHGKHYLFIDEIQAISSWQKPIIALLKEKKVDIYISSSSYDILTKAARERTVNKKFVEIPFKPLSFAEYEHNTSVAWNRGCGLLNRAIAIRSSIGAHFKNYCLYGGFPAAFTEETPTKKSRMNDIYSSIILRDVIQHSKIHNIELLEYIVRHIFENIGRENSTMKITDYLKKRRYKKNLSLVYNYVKALENAFVIKKIYRRNILTGKTLRTNVKYFIEDHALLNAVMEIEPSVSNGIYENILVNDLIRRGFAVFTGKLKAETINFVALQNNKTVFIQTFSKDEAAPDVFITKTAVFKQLDDLQLGDAGARLKYAVFFEDDVSETERSNEIKYITLQNFLLLDLI